MQYFVSKNFFTGCELYAGLSVYNESKYWQGFYKNWNILLVISGKAYVKTNSSFVALPKYSLTIIPPGEKRVFKSTERWDCYWIHFDKNIWVDNLAMNWPKTTNIFQINLNLKDFRHIKSLFINTLQVVAEQRSGWYHLGYTFVQAIIFYGNMCNGNGLLNRQISLSQKILDNFALDIDIDTWAKKCAMSRSLFFKNFKEIFGISPRKYQEKEIMKQIQLLLLNSNFTLTEIASEFYFDNASYLSNRFKKHFGISPQKYRENNIIYTPKH